MTPLFKKLNFKGHPTVYLLNAPESFAVEKEEMAPFTSFKTTIDASDRIQFFLAFVTTKQEIDHFASVLEAQIDGDAVIWFAYPKKSSKNIRRRLTETMAGRLSAKSEWKAYEQ